MIKNQEFLISSSLVSSPDLILLPSKSVGKQLTQDFDTILSLQE